MYARKDLTALNSTLVVDSPSEKNGTVSLQYISGAAGTVVVEGLLSEAAADDVTANWHILTLTKTDASAVTSLSAAGIAYAENYYAKVRARKSVGAASCIVILGVTYG